MSARFSEKGQPYDGFAQSDSVIGSRWTGKVELIPHMLDQPLRWKEPKLIFVDSMSDLFHESLTEDDILKVFDIMRQADWHTYQVLTKRAQRLWAMSPRVPWLDNVWMGVSVEDQNVEYRIGMLRECDAKVKFLSLEPLIGPLPDLNLDGIDWVIVGGESGVNSRPMKKEWVIDLRDQCDRALVPFFFKQWGGRNKKKSGRLLDGRTYSAMPTAWISPDVDGPDMADFAEAYYG